MSARAPKRLLMSDASSRSLQILDLDRGEASVIGPETDGEVSEATLLPTGVAFRSGIDIWSIGMPFPGLVTRLGTSYPLVKSRAGDSVFVERGSVDAPRVQRLGLNGKSLSDPMPIPPRTALLSEHELGWLLRRGPEYLLYADDLMTSIGAGGDAAVAGRRLIIQESPTSLVIVDLASLSESRVARPRGVSLWSGLYASPHHDDVAVLDLPGVGLVSLYVISATTSTPLRIATFAQSPHLLWSDDGEWLIAVEHIDYSSSLVSVARRGVWEFEEVMGGALAVPILDVSSIEEWEC